MKTSVHNTKEERCKYDFICCRIIIEESLPFACRIHGLCILASGNQGNKNKERNQANIKDSSEEVIAGARCRGPSFRRSSEMVDGV